MTALVTVPPTIFTVCRDNNINNLFSCSGRICSSLHYLNLLINFRIKEHCYFSKEETIISHLVRTLLLVTQDTNVPNQVNNLLAQFQVEISHYLLRLETVITHQIMNILLLNYEGNYFQLPR